MENLVTNYLLYNGFYNNKKVFITGHTGFKGSWLCLLLNSLGADVYGYALKPVTSPSLFKSAGIENNITSFIGDIRDFKNLLSKLEIVKPDIVIHMAAQPLVRESYRNPVENYEVNVMGTVNILEAVRKVKNIRVVLNVTTDKCYENKEWHWAYRENEPLGGYDPYSNSKACSELVTSSFRSSFFNPENYQIHKTVLVTARAGNVIGGGDWSSDRLIPDFIRSIISEEKVEIRNPTAIRPWQHVLDCLSGYLTLIEKASDSEGRLSGAWNFGPEESDARDVKWIIEQLCKKWGNAEYIINKEASLHEANYLKLDCSKSKNELSWYPRWNIETALDKVVEWNKSFIKNENVKEICIRQLNDYFITN